MQKSFRYKKLFVTGGAGFIGTNFIKMLLDEGLCSVVCYDKLTYAANLEALEEHKNYPNFEFIKGDVADPVAVESALIATAPDCIVNFAAESHVDRSIENSREFIRTNVQGTATLLDATRKIFGNGIRFHQISTDEVYGDMPYDSECAPFSETSPLNPSNPYAVTKASADMLVLAYARTYGMNVTVSRSCNNFGAYQHEEKLIPHSVARAVSGKDIALYGNGKNVRQWIYAPDHCRAVLEILERGATGQIYNIGSETLLSNLDLARIILRTLGISEDRISFVEDRPGHDRKYFINSTRLDHTVAPCPRTDFDQAIRETVLYYASCYDPR